MSESLYIRFTMRIPVAMVLEVVVDDDGFADILSVGREMVQAGITPRDVFESADDDERAEIDRLTRIAAGLEATP